MKKATPKKTTKLSKSPRSKHHQRLNWRTKFSRRLFKAWDSVPLGTKILAGVFMFTTLGTAWYVQASVDAANQAYNAAIFDANSMLAYDKLQIKTAGIVGPRSQLIREITSLSSAPDDLQPYLINDYKLFKKSCVVNGKLVAPVAYELKSIVYDQFALVQKSCNGPEQEVLAKISGRWTKVYTGNTPMKCSLANDFNIPQGIHSKCTDDNGNIYLNANP